MAGGDAPDGGAGLAPKADRRREVLGTSDGPRSSPASATFRLDWTSLTWIPALAAHLRHQQGSYPVSRRSRTPPAVPVVASSPGLPAPPPPAGRPGHPPPRHSVPVAASVRSPPRRRLRPTRPPRGFTADTMVQGHAFGPQHKLKVSVEGDVTSL